ncbi:MAG TPA: gluconate 2-dehydrogenase subunit 3 family protein [Candidatus Binatia bacterium]|nr:gluconate 2-dehydrogenase subunit 3 family protein [Candidatus Binatia bacterium]
MRNEPGRIDLTAEGERTLASVLDEIIPPSSDGRLPGAGAIDLVGYIKAAMPRLPELWSMIVHGIAELDGVAEIRHGRRFADLSGDQKVTLLNEQAFVLPLSLHAFVGYYQHPRVVAALGHEPRPPHPAGYTMESNDLALLDTVRRRPKLYREC